MLAHASTFLAAHTYYKKSL